jgi:hypothetical protein
MRKKKQNDSRATQACADMMVCSRMYVNVFPLLRLGLSFSFSLSLSLSVCLSPCISAFVFDLHEDERKENKRTKCVRIIMSDQVKLGF